MNINEVETTISSTALNLCKERVYNIKGCTCMKFSIFDVLKFDFQRMFILNQLVFPIISAFVCFKIKLNTFICNFIIVFMNTNSVW